MSPGVVRPGVPHRFLCAAFVPRGRRDRVPLCRLPEPARVRHAGAVRDATRIAAAGVQRLGVAGNQVPCHRVVKVSGAGPRRLRMVPIEEGLVDDAVRREGVVVVGGCERGGRGTAVFRGRDGEKSVSLYATCPDGKGCGKEELQLHFVMEQLSSLGDW